LASLEQLEYSSSKFSRTTSQGDAPCVILLYMCVYVFIKFDIIDKLNLLHFGFAYDNRCLDTKYI